MVDEVKRDQIRTMVQHGRDLLHIYDYLQVSPDEQAELDEDEAFQEVLRFAAAAYREQQEELIEAAKAAETSRGVSTTLRWDYERRFGPAGTGKPERPHYPFEDESTEDLRKKSGTPSRPFDDINGNMVP